jgi:hypothetical protein
MGNNIIHYPNAKIILNDGDEIRVKYIRKVSYNAKTLKRLCGWVYDIVLIGNVNNGTVCFKDEKGGNNFSHCVYNIELYLAQQYLYLIDIRHNPQQLKLW